MKKKSLSDLLGCAIGAFVGTLIAIEIHSRFILGAYFWILGAFAGGIIGWFIGEFNELYTSVVRSYREVVNWKPDKIHWEATFSLIAGFVACALSSGLLAFMTFSFIPEKRPIVTMSVAITLVPCMAVFVVTSLATVGFSICAMVSLFCNVRKNKDDIKLGLALLKFGNPIVLPFFGIWLVASYIWQNGTRIVNKIISMTYFVGNEIVQFSVRAFIYAHSEKRRIRFVGAFLGTVIGFFFGSAILGAVAGIIAGGISREIAIRWLNFIPAEAR